MEREGKGKEGRGGERKEREESSGDFQRVPLGLWLRVDLCMCEGKTTRHQRKIKHWKRVGRPVGVGIVAPPARVERIHTVGDKKNT